MLDSDNDEKSSTAGRYKKKYRKRDEVLGLQAATAQSKPGGPEMKSNPSSQESKNSRFMSKFNKKRKPN